MNLRITPEMVVRLRSAGITHLASICKQYYHTEYYHLASLDQILDNGGKMPFSRSDFGVNGSHFDWTHVLRFALVPDFLANLEK